MRYSHGCLPITCLCYNRINVTFFLGRWHTRSVQMLLKETVICEFHVSKLCYYCIPCVHWKVVVLLKWQPAFQSLVWRPQFNLNIIWKLTVVGYLTWKKKWKWERTKMWALGELCRQTRQKKTFLFAVTQMYLTKQALCYKLWSSQEKLNNLWLVPFASFYI